MRELVLRQCLAAFRAQGRSDMLFTCWVYAFHAAAAVADAASMEYHTAEAVALAELHQIAVGRIQDDYRCRYTPLVITALAG